MLMVTINLRCCPARLHNVLNRFLYLFTAYFGDMRSAPREILVERFGNLKLPLGGKYEYKGVRGKQGWARDKFQGCTPKKTHFTELFDNPQEAAVALATLKCELAAGHDPALERKPRKKRGRLFGTAQSR